MGFVETTGIEAFGGLRTKGCEIIWRRVIDSDTDKTNTVLPLIGLLDLEFCMLFSHVHIRVRLVRYVAKDLVGTLNW